MHRYIPVALIALGLSPLYAQTAPAPASKPAAPSLNAPASGSSVLPPITVAPEKRAKIEKLLTTLTVDTQLQNMLKGSQQRVHAIGEQRMAAAQTDEQKKLTTDYINQMDAAASQELVWAKMEDVVIQTYAQHFSDADLDAYLTFFSTPAGKDFITQSPLITNQVLDYNQTLMRDLVPKLQEITKTFNEKLKAATPLTLQPLDPPHSSTPATSTAPKN